MILLSFRCFRVVHLGQGISSGSTLSVQGDRILFDSDKSFSGDKPAFISTGKLIWVTSGISI